MGRNCTKPQCFNFVFSVHWVLPRMLSHLCVQIDLWGEEYPPFCSSRHNQACLSPAVHSYYHFSSYRLVLHSVLRGIFIEHLLCVRHHRKDIANIKEVKKHLHEQSCHSAQETNCAKTQPQIIRLVRVGL